MQGLNTAWFNNTALAGSPDAVTLGLPGAVGGAVNRQWGTAVPMAGVNSDNFSVRMTGYLSFPSAGTYTFQFDVDDGARLWIDDALALSQLTYGVSGGSTQITATAGQKQRIRVEYNDLTGNAHLVLKWKAPGASTFSDIPGAQFSPDYGLTTSTTTDDAAPSGIAGISAGQVSGLTSSATYDKPWLGLVAQSSTDPMGLNLRTQNTYTANLQRATRTLLAQVAAGATTATKTSSYWGGNDTLTTSICGLPAGTRQNGFVKQVTSPAPATGTAVTSEFIYDNLGRTVGVKRGPEGWTCTTYDGRDRPTSVTIPPFGSGTNTVPSRLMTTWYTSDGTPQGDPLVQVESDTALTGTITTVTDLLGRVLTYTDVWGTITTNTYENLTGRSTEVTVTTPGSAPKAMQYSYDIDGRVTQIRDAGSPIAYLAYSNGELVAETHPGGAGNAGNGSAWTDLTRDGAGALSGMSWTFPTADTLRQEVIRSQSGRIVADTLTRGADIRRSTYGYDTAGRLVSAAIPRHQLTYGFDTAGGCGVSTAGLNGNRTASTDSKDGAAPTVTSYCYDNADRLTSTSVTGVPLGATPVTDGLTAGELGYDGHGNTVRLADQVLVYDAADQHVKTVLADGTSITYTRDGSGRIVQRNQINPDGGNELQKYTYIGPGVPRGGC